MADVHGEKAYLISGIKLQGPDAEELHDQPLGANTESLIKAAQGFHDGCKKHPYLPALFLILDLVDEKKGISHKACISLDPSGEIFLTVPE